MAMDGNKKEKIEGKKQSTVYELKSFNALMEAQASAQGEVTLADYASQNEQESGGEVHEQSNFINYKNNYSAYGNNYNQGRQPYL